MPGPLVGLVSPDRGAHGLRASRRAQGAGAATLWFLPKGLRRCSTYANVLAIRCHRSAISKKKSRATGSRVRVASSSHLAACCRQSVTFSDGLLSIAGSVCPGWCAYARASRLTIRNAANSMAENSMAEKDLTCGWKRRFFTARKKVAIVLSLVWRQ
jgi:hypothetical protein